MQYLAVLADEERRRSGGGQASRYVAVGDMSIVMIFVSVVKVMISEHNI